MINCRARRPKYESLCEELESFSEEMRISSLESKTSPDSAFAMIMPQQMTRHAAIRSRACRDLSLIFSAP
ncbi:hypothetical protein AJ87_31575 [Rhizobium yanglingense]|nr:hypothetical protein AJ87_31575 [Rhizobium yanglingense]